MPPIKIRRALCPRRPVRSWALASAAGMFLLMLPAAGWGARPFVATERADPVEQGHSRFELGTHFQQFSHDDRVTAMQIELTDGLLSELDFEVEVPFLFFETGTSGQNGLGDVKLKAKVRLLRAREGRPVSLATQLIVKLPTCDRTRQPACTGKTDVGFVAIASKSFKDVAVHLNVGYTIVARPSVPSPPLPPPPVFRDTLSYSLAFDYPMDGPPVNLIAEIFGQTNPDRAKDSHPLSVMAGVQYHLLDSVSVDGSIERGLNGASPEIAVSAGLSYFF